MQVEQLTLGDVIGYLRKVVRQERYYGSNRDFVSEFNARVQRLAQSLNEEIPRYGMSIMDAPKETVLPTESAQCFLELYCFAEPELCGIRDLYPNNYSH